MQVLKIKEMRINELPIPRIMDTGMIDTTIQYGNIDTDTGADGSGTDGTELEIGVGAAFFNNFYGTTDGSNNSLYNLSLVIKRLIFWPIFPKFLNLS